MKVNDASKKAQDLVWLIFCTTGLKKIGEFRSIVGEAALFSDGANQNNSWSKKTENWEMSYPNRCFLQGWEAAGGGDVWVTWHKGNGGYLNLTFWREDPAELLEKLLQEHRPDLLVMGVQAS
jgi:hypothetical protein